MSASGSVRREREPTIPAGDPLTISAGDPWSALSEALSEAYMLKRGGGRIKYGILV